MYAALFFLFKNILLIFLDYQGPGSQSPLHTTTHTRHQTQKTHLSECVFCAWHLPVTFAQRHGNVARRNFPLCHIAVHFQCSKEVFPSLLHQIPFWCGRGIHFQHNNKGSPLVAVPKSFFLMQWGGANPPYCIAAPSIPSYPHGFANLWWALYLVTIAPFHCFSLIVDCKNLLSPDFFELLEKSHIPPLVVSTFY